MDYVWREEAVEMNNEKGEEDDEAEKDFIRKPEKQLSAIQTHGELSQMDMGHFFYQYVRCMAHFF